MPTIKDLMDQYCANAVIIADRGNGSAYGLSGQCVRVDNNDDFMAKYGDIQMMPLDTPHKSSDGYSCEFASAWINESTAEYSSSSDYEFRIYF